MRKMKKPLTRPKVSLVVVVVVVFVVLDFHFGNKRTINHEPYED